MIAAYFIVEYVVAQASKGKRRDLMVLAGDNVNRSK